MRHHKHRPLKQEQKKQPVPALAKAKEEKSAFFAPKVVTAASAYSPIELARRQALYLMAAACKAIESGHPEQAALQQSKALELAQQKLASEYWHIDAIQDVLHRVKRTLAQAQFSSSGAGETDGHIPLGAGFLTFNLKTQARELLRQAILATPLPARNGLPVAGYEHTCPAAAWVQYVYCLLKLLPERPYLITGTPIRPAERDTEEPDAGSEPNTSDEVEGIVPGERGLRLFFRNLLRRIRNR